MTTSPRRSPRRATATPSTSPARTPATSSSASRSRSVGKTDGGEPAALDGGGRGTVLTIKAEGVVIEDLTLEHSGRGSDVWALWGDAGVFVDADKATLRGLTVVDNDWGVVFHGGAGSLIETSTIEDNVRHGIRVVGGHEHRIVANSVNRNSVGISIDALFAKTESSPLGNLASPDAARLLALQRQVAVRSEDVLVADNDVRGNGSYGIEVAWESERITVKNNQVTETGIERPVDQALISAWEHSVSKGAGVAVSLDRAPYGSGIYLFCLVTDSTVIGNKSHDNASAGIGLDLVNDNRVVANVVKDNRVGIMVSTSNRNTFERNVVSANADYGIIIAAATAGAAAIERQSADAQRHVGKRRECLRFVGSGAHRRRHHEDDRRHADDRRRQEAAAHQPADARDDAEDHARAAQARHEPLGRRYLRQSL